MNEKSKDDASFAELMPNVKRLDNRYINIHLDRTKSVTLPARQALTSDPGFDFSTISYQELAEISESFFNAGIQKKLQKKIRQGLLAVDDRLDLHGYNQQQATKALIEFIDQAVSFELRFVIVVHGKGSRSDKEAVLKPLVQNWLAQQPMVLAWCPAQPKHGGSGASYIYLKKLANL